MTLQAYGKFLPRIDNYCELDADVKDAWVTDGSCMTSSACQNPSLTYLAITGRACRYAVEQMRQSNLYRR